jgi:acyl-CoA thioesterase
VIIPISGHHSSQARATGHVGDREIFTVNALLGRRPCDGDPPRFRHGLIHLWSDQGRLLATGSQSFIVRLMD